MKHWYYSTDGAHSHGPVPAAQLRTMLADARLPASTLYWHDGLPGWQRRDQLADEPDLHFTASSDAPLPVQPPPVPLLPALPDDLPSPPAAAGGNARGCLIAGVVIGGVCLIPLLAILAAIAFPAYNTYLTRSQVATVLAQTDALQQVMDASLASQEHCPGKEAGPVQAALVQARSAAHVDAVELVTAVNGNCGMAITLKDLQRDDGLTPAMLWLEQTAQARWVCRSTLPDTHLPGQCQRTQDSD